MVLFSRESSFVCFLNADCLPENFTSGNVPSIRFLGWPRAASSGVVSEEFVRKSLTASPFMKPRFTPGGDKGYGGCIGRSRSVYNGF